MRTLLFVKTDQGQQIIERVPGPWSHSAPTEVVVFEMTAEEAQASETEDRTTPASKEPVLDKRKNKVTTPDPATVPGASEADPKTGDA